MAHCRISRSRFFSGLLAFAVLACAAHLLCAQQAELPKAVVKVPPRPAASETDHKVAHWVAALLEQHHLARHKVDDEVSRRCFRAFLKEFDPQKIYFEQRDMDEFQKYETELDDQVKQGDLAFAYLVYDRFMTRVKERLPLVEELVNAAHDYSHDELMSMDYDNIDYARTPDDLHERWRKKIKYDLLLQRLAKKPLPEAEQKEKVLKRYRFLLHRMEQTDSDELLEMYLNALATSFDPHSSYMSPTTLEDFNISMRLHLEGIGARLRSEDGYTIVAEVLAGGAADVDGHLQVEDKIIGVAQDGVNFTDVVDMKLTDVVKLIRGKQGTLVQLRVLPQGKTDPLDYKITRARILLTGSEARGEVIEHGKRGDGKPYRIGYVDLPSFYADVAAANAGEKDPKSSTADVRKLLESFQQGEGVDEVVIDLRNNGGGALNEAINMVDLFIDRGPVVQVKDPSGLQHYDDEDPGMVYAGPLVVLVNKLSASASEIFAGAIQDYGRGLIVGDQSTHGKGTVQTVLDIGRQIGPRFGRPPQLGALKLTIQQFYRVNGDSTQSRGVLSDVVLPSVWDHMEIGESHLPQALPFERVPPVEHAVLGSVPAELKKQLQALSDKRRESSAEFRKLEEDIARVEARQKSKQITLNENQLRDQMSRGDKAAEDGLPDLDGSRKRNAPVFEHTYYNDECLEISEDFLRLGGHRPVAARL